MSVHALLNLLNELGKRDRMRGLPSILSLFHNKFNKFNNTRARVKLFLRLKYRIYIKGPKLMRSNNGVVGHVM